jgi:hypothetical protein
MTEILGSHSATMSVCVAVRSVCTICSTEWYKEMERNTAHLLSLPGKFNFVVLLCIKCTVNVLQSRVLHQKYVWWFTSWWYIGMYAVITDWCCDLTPDSPQITSPVQRCFRLRLTNFSAQTFDACFLYWQTLKHRAFNFCGKKSFVLFCLFPSCKFDVRNPNVRKVN